MKVTRIEEISKSRYRVCIGEEQAFVLYRGELRSFQIREGEEVSREDYERITGELLPKRAKLRAMNLLKAREYTVKQLYDKLKAGGYPESAINLALDYVEHFHYTDDLRYATAFLRANGEKRSRRRMEQDLLGRGIGRETLERAWSAWEEESGSQDEEAMIQALLAKKGFVRESADLRQRQKLYGFLVRKGFPADLARRAVLSEEEWNGE